MKIGDDVIVIDNFDSNKILRRSKLSGVSKQSGFIYYRVDGQLYHQAIVFPVAAEKALTEILEKRVALKKQLDDHMSVVYEFLNKIARGEFD